MSDQIENQYRFMLESKARVIVKYHVDISDPNKPKIVFVGYPVTESSNSNQLNRFIADSLNRNTSRTYGQPKKMIQIKLIEQQILSLKYHVLVILIIIMYYPSFL